MPANPDLWYVRLPNGRVVRTRSTKLLRHHVKSGRIPRAVQARRSPTQPWQSLNQIKELADLAPKKATARPRVKVPLSGLRRIFDEMLHAGEVSLHRAKLITSACATLGICLAMIIGEWALASVAVEWTWFATLLLTLVLASIIGVCTSIVTKMTAIELSHFRPSSFEEVRTQFVSNALRLMGVYVLVGGTLFGSIYLLRALPGWIPIDGAWPALVTAMHSVRLILELLCWSALALSLLLAPILVIEESTVLHSIRQWIGLLRPNLNRVYSYQAIGFAIALVLAAPILIPLALALEGMPWITEWMPLYVVVGVALTPVLNYLLVAHVFVYLNLRYEFYYSARNR